MKRNKSVARVKQRKPTIFWKNSKIPYTKCIIPFYPAVFGILITKFFIHLLRSSHMLSGCHVQSCACHAKSLQLCPTLWDPMD